MKFIFKKRPGVFIFKRICRGFIKFRKSGNCVGPFSFLMNIPLPDLSDFSDDDETPEMSSLSPILSFDFRSNPTISFDTPTRNGIFYDSRNPIYETQTCMIYISKGSCSFYVLKVSDKHRLLKHEWEMYKSIGEAPTIIHALNYWNENGLSFIQLEYAPGDSVNKLINFIDLENAWRILAHISLALQKIHSAGYIHLDVSPSNILEATGTFPRKSIYKLVDFGSVIPEGSFVSGNEGAGPYVSPEALRFPDAGPISFPSDVWSLGAVMYEVVTHKNVPRDSIGYNAIRNGSFDLSLIPDEFEVIKRMLRVNPLSRPTINEILKIEQVQKLISSDESLNAKPGYIKFIQKLDKSELRRRESFDAF